MGKLVSKFSEKEQFGSGIERSESSQVVAKASLRGVSGNGLERNKS